MTCRVAPLALLLVLAGCSGLGTALGLDRSSPDEFTVTTRAPLSMPTDTALPVPQPGAPRPQEPAAQLAAEAALAPSVELAAAHAGRPTPGQQALLAAAGPPAPANIRATVDAEATRANSPGLTSKLAFWEKAAPPGKVLDPVKEAARLRAAGILR